MCLRRILFLCGQLGTAAGVVLGRLGAAALFWYAAYSSREPEANCELERLLKRRCTRASAPAGCEARVRLANGAPADGRGTPPVASRGCARRCKNVESPTPVGVLLVVPSMATGRPVVVR